MGRPAGKPCELAGPAPTTDRRRTAAGAKPVRLGDPGRKVAGNVSGLAARRPVKLQLTRTRGAILSGAAANTPTTLDRSKFRVLRSSMTSGTASPEHAISRPPLVCGSQRT